jgi:AcrR family transcriptional regulator
LEMMLMTPPQGRPRSEDARQAVLSAAIELMLEGGLRAASVDQIAERSSVSKTTIYKWWPNKVAVAVDAFYEELMSDSPVPDTGSAATDFQVLLRAVMAFYASRLGTIYAQLIGESQFYPDERDRIRSRQVDLRREAVMEIWNRGVEHGELNSNVDPEVVLDLIFGAAMYRKATGHGGMEPSDADAIVATAMDGLLRR